MPEILIEENEQYAGWGNRRTRPIAYTINESGCHVCVSHKPGSKGYPRIRLGNKLWQMNRYIWVKYHGDVPSGQFVLHTCDNRMCINPDHYFLDTIAENNADMRAKGRAVYQRADWPEIIERVAAQNRGKPSKSMGSKNGNSKLNEAQVLEIRALGGSISKSELARRYSVDRKLIHLILLKEVWKHV